MSTERARRFYFTTERDSYAAKLGRRQLGRHYAFFSANRRRADPLSAAGENETREGEREVGELDRAESGPRARRHRAA